MDELSELISYAMVLKDDEKSKIFCYTCPIIGVDEISRLSSSLFVDIVIKKSLLGDFKWKILESEKTDGEKPTFNIVKIDYAIKNIDHNFTAQLSLEKKLFLVFITDTDKDFVFNTVDKIMEYGEGTCIYLTDNVLIVTDEVLDKYFTKTFSLSDSLYRPIKLDANSKLNNEFPSLEDTYPQKEMVNHPSHYQSSKFEAIDVIEEFNLNFNTGNAVKYILRAGKKFEDKTLEDLKKAVWYLEREIKKLGEK
jgi:hypothetical protein